MPGLEIEHVPPQNLEAEQATLGSMMIDPDACYHGIEKLKPEDFYRPVHSEIFAALKTLKLAKGDEPIDMITVTEELRKRGKLEECGGVEYLIALHESVPTAANMEHYAQIVLGKSIRRMVIDNANKAKAIAYDESSDLDPVDELVRLALEINTGGKAEWANLGDVVQEAWERIEQMHKGNPLKGIPFGIGDFDRLSGGVGPDPEFVIIAARPSNGKTVLLNELAMNALKAGKRVLYFSQETSKVKLVQRMLWRMGRVDSHAMRWHEYTPTQEEDAFSRLAEASGVLFNYGDLLKIEDEPMTAAGIVSKAKRAVLRYANTPEPVELVLIDYLQLIEPGGKFENRTTAVQYITQSLQRLMKSTGVSVVAAAQLKRFEGKGPEPRPQLSDLREGGNMEAEADKVVLVYNPPPTKEGDDKAMRDAELIMAKSRDDKTGKVCCSFYGPYLQFRSRTDREENQ